MGHLAEDIPCRESVQRAAEEICWENYEWFNVENFAGWWEWQEIKRWNGRLYAGLPWLSSGQHSEFPWQGMWVRSLVRELKSHKVKGMEEKEKNKKQLRRNENGHTLKKLDRASQCRSADRCHSVKESACQTRDSSSIPGLGRSSKIGNGNPLQYSCLGNPTHRGIWLATVQGVAKNWTWLIYKITATKTDQSGLPSWLSGEESTCQWRRHRFDLWSRKIPHATQQWRPSTAMNKTDEETKAGYMDRGPDLFLWLCWLQLQYIGSSCVMRDLSNSLWLWCPGLIVSGCGFSCSTACRILVPWPEIKPLFPALQGGLLTTGSPGKSKRGPDLKVTSCHTQHQGLFQWVSSLLQVAKILELQFKHQSFQWIFRVDFL